MGYYRILKNTRQTVQMNNGVADVTYTPDTGNPTKTKKVICTIVGSDVKHVLLIPPSGNKTFNEYPTSIKPPSSVFKTAYFRKDTMIGFDNQYSKYASDILGKEHRVVKEFSYFWVDGVDNPLSVVVIIPPGYLTDGASVPSSLQWLYKPFDNYYYAAIIHDYLCEYLTVYDKEGNPHHITREYADEIFYKALKYTGVKKSTREVFKAAVDYYRKNDYTRLGSDYATELEPDKEQVSIDLINRYNATNIWE